MGTNYYWQWKTESGRYKDLHIGKCSYGWQFYFQGYNDFESPDGKHIKSWKDWQRVFENCKGKIYDEYDERIPVEYFKTIVEETKGGKDHRGLSKEYPSLKEHEWQDEEGWDFTWLEFS